MKLTTVEHELVADILWNLRRFEELMGVERYTREAKLTVRSMLRLSEYLRELEAGDEVDLHMATYFSNEKPDTTPCYIVAHELRRGEVARAEHWCGTSACAMGWSTVHPDMPVLPEHFTASGSLFMNNYGREYYPLMYNKCLSHGDVSVLWHSCFSATLPDSFSFVAKRLVEVAHIITTNEKLRGSESYDRFVWGDDEQDIQTCI